MTSINFQTRAFRAAGFALLLGAILAWSGAAMAQSMEIIALRYRTAEQLTPQLMPMLEPGGALTGTGDKLFVRTSPRNLADLRRIVAELDRMPRRLTILVRQGGERVADGRSAGVSGDVSLGRNARIFSSGRGDADTATVEIRRGDSTVRAGGYEARTANRDDVVQQVQTIEGGSAWIDVGRSIPLPMRQTVMTPRGPVVTESIVWRDAGTGFYAEPRLSGDRVTLEISPSRDVPGAAGSVEVQRLSTTVSGRLGEWIELGGSVQERSADSRGTTSYATRDSRDDRRVWLKVDELP